MPVNIGDIIHSPNEILYIEGTEGKMVRFKYI